ncbi:hypothetical protein AMS68_007008 [Peltaster fructicola]|uniref:Uncharacterized protein n=1 Tax=Peltaster fructicola TaxID=286661 RepID=A0A6H0Y3J9_9PEZI|nr:hypothetical protein AMS68_007008 [Peltaster fructicola]
MTESSHRPDRRLDGRVAIVTGAGSAGDGIGNGRAAAILLAEIGCSVMCVDLDICSAGRTAEMIQEEGTASARASQGDVTIEDDCRRIVSEAVEIFGRLDILVNNVGIGGAKGTAETVDSGEWTKGMEINVGSMVKMAKYCIPEMTKNKGQWRGSIVNMASVAGLRGGTPHLLYPTSKGAIVVGSVSRRLIALLTFQNMTRAMAVHHAPQGIRVNCVCPGMVYTPMVRVKPPNIIKLTSQMYAGGMSEEAREARKNRSLLKTEGNGWDVGVAVRFLSSDEARWLTGVILPVDAGATAATSTEMPRDATV